MKKIIAIILVVALTAAISVGITLAYLTDREEAVNVFTMGNVEIDLNESFDDGTELRISEIKNSLIVCLRSCNDPIEPSGLSSSVPALGMFSGVEKVFEYSASIREISFF